MLDSLSLPLAITAMHWLFIIPICLLSIFLTLLILVQRGRGGGLTGALGGMGGQSAFGTKAGDMFTRITMITAVFWLLLCATMLKIKNSDATLFSGNTGGNARPESKIETDSKLKKALESD